jgi:DNA-binding NarL/FixJ family response regulator
MPRAYAEVTDDPFSAARRCWDARVRDSRTPLGRTTGHSVTVSQRAKLLIVDDHAVVRSGLRELVSREKDLTVVGEARTVDEALQRCAELLPDVVILDISLGQDSGFSLIASLRRLYPKIALLVLSMHDERVFAQRALQVGANGYVGKHEDGDVLLAAVRSVLAGKIHVSEAVNDLFLASLAGGSRQASPRAGLERLSNRELEVMRLLGSGLRTGQIAERLGISPRTIETHRTRIKEKLGVSSAGELVILAVNWLRDGFLNTNG